MEKKVKKTKKQMVIEYLKKHDFGSSIAMWDSSRVYYGLTAKEIVNVCNYLNKYYEQ